MLLTSLLLGALTSAPGPREVDLTTREPVWVQASIGREAAGFASASELYALTSEVLEATTTLAPASYDAGAEARCLSENPRADPVVCGVLAAHAAEVQLILRVLVQASGDASALIVEAVDVPAARARVRDALHASGGAQSAWDRAADEVLAGLVTASFPGVGRPAQVSRRLRAHLEGPLSDLFPPRGAATATLELRLDPRDAAVSLDARELGSAGPEGLRLLGVPPGEHVLEATHPERRSIRRALRLEAGEARALELELLEDHRAAWIATAWSGGALLAGAAALGVFAVVDERPRPQNVDLGLARFGGPSALPALGPEVRGDGPLVAGLVSSLAVSGAILTTLGILERDAPRAPWWEIALGLGAGLLTYGAFELVDVASR